MDFYDYRNDCSDDCYSYDECDMDDMDDHIDYCHECGGYGDDWSIDENGSW